MQLDEVDEIEHWLLSAKDEVEEHVHIDSVLCRRCSSSMRLRRVDVSCVGFLLSRRFLCG
jgi:hypothetical protein